MSNLLLYHRIAASEKVFLEHIRVGYLKNFQCCCKSTSVVLEFPFKPQLYVGKPTFLQSYITEESSGMFG